MKYAVYAGKKGKAEGFPSRLVLYLAPIENRAKAQAICGHAYADGYQFTAVIELPETEDSQ